MRRCLREVRSLSTCRTFRVLHRCVCSYKPAQTGEQKDCNNCCEGDQPSRPITNIIPAAGSSLFKRLCLKVLAELLLCASSVFSVSLWFIIAQKKQPQSHR